MKREWEAADEVSEEPNRIKTDERWEPSALSWQGGGSQETERDGRLTGGKSEEIQADQTQAGRLEDSEFQALRCCTEEQPHTSVSGKKPLRTSRRF